jgi:hypothetical protein
MAQDVLLCKAAGHRVVIPRVEIVQLRLTVKILVSVACRRACRSAGNLFPYASKL